MKVLGRHILGEVQKNLKVTSKVLGSLHYSATKSSGLVRAGTTGYVMWYGSARNKGSNTKLGSLFINYPPSIFLL